MTQYKKSRNSKNGLFIPFYKSKSELGIKILILITFLATDGCYNLSVTVANEAIGNIIHVCWEYMVSHHVEGAYVGEYRFN